MKLNPSLKRKVTKQELENVAKRVKIAIHALEAVFFNRVIVTSIPKSRVDHFILEEKQNSSNQCTPDFQGEYLEAKKSQSAIPIVANSCYLATSIAEEVGLIKPPTYPRRS